MIKVPFVSLRQADGRRLHSSETEQKGAEQADVGSTAELKFV